MKPQIVPINPTYKKTDQDLWVLNSKDIPIDFSLVKDTQIVHLGPGAVGGNHKHPRIEWFVAIGPLKLFWLDENQNQQEVEMNPQGELFLIKVPPFLPHAVVNTSQTEKATLYELADAELNEVEKVQVV